MSTQREIDLVRKWTGSYEADCVDGYFAAVEAVCVAAELTIPLSTPSDATIEQVRAWGNANYRKRIAAEHQAANYKQALEELRASVAAAGS